MSVWYWSLLVFVVFAGCGFVVHFRLRRDRDEARERRLDIQRSLMSDPFADYYRLEAHLASRRRQVERVKARKAIMTTLKRARHHR